MIGMAASYSIVSSTALVAVPQAVSAAARVAGNVITAAPDSPPDVAAARAEMATGGWICCSSAMQSSWGTPGISIRNVEPAPVTAIADRHRLCSVVPEIIDPGRSEEHTSELQSIMRISYAVFCLKK